MPLHRLAVPPADVSGAGLRLALNAPAPTPLVSYRLAHPAGGALTLGVLGASHVVAVDDVFCEEISCTARGEAALPERAEAPGYRLDSTTRTLDTAEFDGLARQLSDRCERDDRWLGGAFPGDDAALTVLTAEPDGAGWRWQTWHLYPEQRGGTVVHTVSWWRP